MVLDVSAHQHVIIQLAVCNSSRDRRSQGGICSIDGRRDLQSVTGWHPRLTAGFLSALDLDLAMIAGGVVNNVDRPEIQRLKTRFARTRVHGRRILDA